MQTGQHCDDGYGNGHGNRTMVMVMVLVNKDGDLMWVDESHEDCEWKPD